MNVPTVYDSMLRPRVRIAPSPTGKFHVGRARTALFNWLFARHHNGAFILRIEDTDIDRSKEIYLDDIMESLKWLGLNWDEGPYFQSQRLSLYREHAERLLKENKAYYCYCTPQELEAKRKLALQQRRKPKYDRRCLNLSEREKKHLRDLGHVPAIRFKMPQTGQTVIKDLIRGSVAFDNTELEDLVILRPNGMPTYNFSVVVDDVLMNITHIIRGDEHINNTPKQLLLLQAFDYQPPEFAHVPMILGADRSRLSARHGAKSILEYREMGYLPEALINFLARLGWAHGDQEIFSKEELIEKFSLAHVGKSASIFDGDKLLWLNHHYIKTLDAHKLAELLRAFLVKQKIVPSEEANSIKQERLIEVIRLLRERSRTLFELAESARYIFSDEFYYDPKGAEEFFTPESLPLLKGLMAELAHLNEFTAARIEEVTRGYLKREGRKLGEIAQTCRMALTGRTEGPGLFETMEILGKEKVSTRLQKAMELIEKGG